MWFIGVEVEQETSAPPPKKNPGSAPEGVYINICDLSEKQDRNIFDKVLKPQEKYPLRNLTP